MVGNWSRCLSFIYVFYLIGSQLDKGRQVDIVYLDYFKAFDQVSHRKILSVPRQQGFRSNLLARFDSYLHKRFQRVIALTVSSRALMTLGVCQG